MLVDGKTTEWRWPSFTPWELRADRGHATPDNFQVWIDTQFLDAIQGLRSAFDKPLMVSSYYRSGAYNSRVSSTGAHGPHTSGRAIDFSISGEDAYLLLQRALRMGFTGIGVNQKGPYAKRFIHIDTLTEKRPRVWSYS